MQEKLILTGARSFQLSPPARVLRQKWSRGQMEARLANMPPCLIGVEACVGAHHLSRKLASLGAEAPDDEVRGDQDRGATGSAGAASGARAAGSQGTGIINPIRAFMLERGIADDAGVVRPA